MTSVKWAIGPPNRSRTSVLEHSVGSSHGAFPPTADSRSTYVQESKPFPSVMLKPRM